MSRHSHVYKAVEEGGKVKIVRVAVVTCGAKMVGLVERVRAFRYRQQVSTKDVRFSEEEARSALAADLGDEREMVVARMAEIDKALEELKRAPTP
jgi:hypothetical protein